MDDLIRRADAIEALEANKSDWDNDYNRPIEKDIQSLKALPSAEAVSREEYDQLEALYDAIRIYDSSAEAVQGYTEWLEKNIVEAETFEWLCEDATDKEWCEKNCKYASIQAECLRHLYEVSKGGGSE